MTILLEKYSFFECKLIRPFEIMWYRFTLSESNTFLFFFCSSSHISVPSLSAGSLRNDGVKAADVLTVLREKVAFVSGQHQSAFVHFIQQLLKLFRLLMYEL